LVAMVSIQQKKATRKKPKTQKTLLCRTSPFSLLAALVLAL
jgi:hypothetical protein